MAEESDECSFGSEPLSLALSRAQMADWCQPHRAPHSCGSVTLAGRPSKQALHGAMRFVGQLKSRFIKRSAALHCCWCRRPGDRTKVEGERGAASGKGAVGKAHARVQVAGGWHPSRLLGRPWNVIESVRRYSCSSLGCCCCCGCGSSSVVSAGFAETLPRSLSSPLLSTVNALAIRTGGGGGCVYTSPGVRRWHQCISCGSRARDHRPHAHVQQLVEGRPAGRLSFSAAGAFWL